MVTFGKEKSTYIYLAILLMSFIINLAIVWLLPGINITACRCELPFYNRRAADLYPSGSITTTANWAPSNKNTIALSALTGLLTTVGAILG